MPQRISQMTAAGALTGDELVEVSRLSSSVTITASTISAQASDNSFNDSGAGFVAAGFAAGDQISVSGFTGNAANNIFSASVTTVAPGKLTIAGSDGDVIVDDAAGESVTITKWETRRTTAQEIAEEVGAVDAGDVAVADAGTYYTADDVEGVLQEVGASLAALGGLVDVLTFEGVIDCSANPNYPAADAGNVYIVSVAGKIGGGSGPNVEAGDMLVCRVDATSTGNHATVGANWSIVQSNIDGAVRGPASSVDGEMALYDSTTGKLIKRASTTGFVRMASGVVTAVDGSNDDFAQRKAGVWTNRTVAQVSADLQATGLVTDAVGFRTIPQNSQSTAYTTVAADSGKHLLHPSGDANARTFTIDSNANVAYPVGTAITFVNETSQVLSIAITSDTLTLAGSTTTGTRSLAQNGVATAIKVTSTKWIISGTGLT